MKNYRESFVTSPSMTRFSSLATLTREYAQTISHGQHVLALLDLARSTKMVKELEFCSGDNLCMINTFYNGKDHHKVSRRHPRSSNWHQIDSIIVKKCHLNSVKSARSYHSADCNTDHLLVVAKTKIVPKYVHRSKAIQKKRINTGNIRNAELKELFHKQFEEQLADIDEASPDKLRTCLKSSIHDSAFKVFGTTRASREDWIEENASTLVPLIEDKRKAFLLYNKNPSESTLNQLRAAKSKLQREVRRCANSYWENLCTNIQRAS